MKKGDLVALDFPSIFGVLLDDTYKDGVGQEIAHVYFANAPEWRKRKIAIFRLRMLNASR